MAPVLPARHRHVIVKVSTGRGANIAPLFFVGIKRNEVACDSSHLSLMQVQAASCVKEGKVVNWRHESPHVCPTAESC